MTVEHPGTDTGADTDEGYQRGLTARTVQMTAMPQMVALLNGFGGAASLLVGGAEFLKSELRAEQIPLDTGITIQLSLLIGAVTFTGSLIAWAKLQEVMTGKPHARAQPSRAGHARRTRDIGAERARTQSYVLTQIPIIGPVVGLIVP